MSENRPGRHQPGILGRYGLRRTVEAHINNGNPTLLAGSDKTGNEMISGHAGVDFPHQVIARDHTADRLVHFGYARGGFVYECHKAMLEPCPICVKTLHKTAADSRFD